MVPWRQAKPRYITERLGRVKFSIDAVQVRTYRDERSEERVGPDQARWLSVEAVKCRWNGRSHGETESAEKEKHASQGQDQRASRIASGGGESGEDSVARWADSDSVPERFSEEILNHEIDAWTAGP
jgi:hypothetical protein